MPALTSLLNPYDRRARFYPMVLSLLPLALGIAAWAPVTLELRGLICSAVVTVALASFLTHLARDQGKKREPELFRRWGGRPSDRVLSYGAAIFAPATLGRRHRVLSKLDPRLKFPKSAAEEKALEDAGTSVYAAATELLLARTRDHTKFGLLFEENMNYGFRRNLWGMKPVAVAGSLLGFASASTRLGVDLWNEVTPSTSAIVGIAVCATLLALWWLRVTPGWVKASADAYARQLAECCDRLGEVAGSPA